MPRAPRFMPWLLLLLLLSLPHTQAAFPQDPLPLLTSDLQGECPVRAGCVSLALGLGSWAVGHQGSLCGRLRADDQRRGADRRGELAPQVSCFSTLGRLASLRGGWVVQNTGSQQTRPEQVQTPLTSRVTLVKFFTLPSQSPELQNEGDNILPRGLI